MIPIKLSLTSCKSRIHITSHVSALKIALLLEVKLSLSLTFVARC